tara:strand:- start:151 stop:486 length:336 start_codon:yes stop_codon:yes gene_type:complete
MMKKNAWTLDDEEILLKKVNSHIYPSGQVIWGAMKKGVLNHSINSCQTHWNRKVKKQCEFTGRQWVLMNQNVVRNTMKRMKINKGKATHQIKQVKVSRSFLWGAFKYERYE